MVKHNFRLEIKNQLDKTRSKLGLQCVANEVIESNIARWLYLDRQWMSDTTSDLLNIKPIHEIQCQYQPQ